MPYPGMVKMSRLPCRAQVKSGTHLTGQRLIGSPSGMVILFAINAVINNLILFRFRFDVENNVSLIKSRNIKSDNIFDIDMTGRTDKNRAERTGLSDVKDFPNIYQS